MKRYLRLENNEFIDTEHFDFEITEDYVIDRLGWKLNIVKKGDTVYDLIEVGDLVGHFATLWLEVVNEKTKIRNDYKLILTPTSDGRYICRYNDGRVI